MGSKVTAGVLTRTKYEVVGGPLAICGQNSKLSAPISSNSVRLGLSGHRQARFLSARRAGAEIITGMKTQGEDAR